EAGAPWPHVSAKPVEETSKSHWALLPIQSPPIPKASQTKTSVHNPIDDFIKAKLEAAGLRPNPPADRATLIRRLTFDVHGLPPTPDEVKAFEQDSSPTAESELVDRLLAS